MTELTIKREPFSFRGKTYWRETGYSDLGYAIVLAVLALEDKRVDDALRGMRITVYAYDSENATHQTPIWPEPEAESP
jgi:hypothetical protein